MSADCRKLPLATCSVNTCEALASPITPVITCGISQRRKIRREEKEQQRVYEQYSEALASAPRDDGAVAVQHTLQIPLSMSIPRRLLIVSLGNPAPYLNTLHSAGHVLLSHLASSSPAQSPLVKSKQYGGGVLSSGPSFTFYQSPSYMNTSGPAVAAAWRAFTSANGGSDAHLVVLHDELELPLGKLSVRAGSASPKGHNGLKSIRDARELRDVEYTRLGIGIGRPVSRDKDAVSAYVLRKINVDEKAKVLGLDVRVWEELARLSGSEG